MLFSFGRLNISNVIRFNLIYSKWEKLYLKYQFGRSVVSLCDPKNYSTPSFPVHSMLGFSVHHQLLESAQTHVHRVGDAIQSSHPLSSPSPPALNLSQHQGLFQGVHASVRWPKYQSFNFSISTSSEYSELISFRIDWFEEVRSSQSLVGCQG